MFRGARTEDIETVYRDRFRSFLLSATAIVGDGDAALDIVQDGFALALRKRRTFRSEGSLEAWVWRIVLNLVRDRQRAQSRDVPAPFLSAKDGASDRHDELTAFLATLPERQRTAVFLRYYADLSYAEIADVLGVRRGTVGASLHAAHRSLRQQLGEAVT